MVRYETTVKKTTAVCNITWTHNVLLADRMEIIYDMIWYTQFDIVYHRLVTNTVCGTEINDGDGTKITVLVIINTITIHH